MSIKDLHSTPTWTYLSIAFSILSVTVNSILFLIDSASFYRKMYGVKESSNTGRLDRVQSGSDSEAVKSQGTATSIDIDISQTSRSTSAKSKPKPSSDHRKPNLIVWRLQVLPLLMYSFFIMTSMISVLHRLGIGSFSDCKPCGVKLTLCAAGKLMMYLVFIYRLHTIYSNTAFQYNTKYLSTMAVFCVLYQSIASVVNLLTVSSATVQIGEETYCKCVYVVLIPIVVLLSDTIVSVGCCYAFIKPIKALQSLIPESRDAELQHAVVKYMTLTSVAVITTMLIMIVIAGLELNGLAALDIVINSLCVFLMNNDRDEWFKYLCCGGKCGSKAVECCCSTNETVV